MENYEMNNDLTIAMLVERNIAPDFIVTGPDGACVEAWELPMGLYLCDVWQHECEDTAIVGSKEEVAALLETE